MMKRWIQVLTVVAMVLAVCPAWAWNWYPLSVPEMAGRGGATHVAVFTYEDLTATATNTAQTFTNAIPAKYGMEFVAMVLDTAFDTGNTNYTGSCALKVGDGSTTDLLMSSTELASDGTEVWVQFAPLAAYTVSGTGQTNTVVSAVARTLATNTFTYLNASTNLATNSIVYVSGVTPTTGSVTSLLSVTSATTGTAKGRKYSASTWNLVFTFTPNVQEALTANTSGKVRVFFRQFDGR